MKTFTYTLILSVLASMMLSSCLGNEKEVEYSDYCVINSFSLGSIKQTHHMRGSKGQDSTYTTVFAGSVFPMSINQRDLTIENRDSLPYGAMVNKVLTNCNFESILLHRPKDIQGLVDTAWVAYNAKDTIDFTKPRTFYVLSADGTGERRYTVSVNVHKMDPNATVWDSLGVTPATMPDQCAVRKMAVLAGKLTLLTQQADGTLTCLSRPAQTKGEWTEQALTGAEDIDLQTLQADGEVLYASTHKGGIVYSVDGQNWRNRMLGHEGLKLVGVSHDCFYALLDGKLMCSAQAAEEWKAETLDDEAGLLPVKDMTLLGMTQKNGNQRLLLMGKNADGTKGRIWSKMWTGDLTEQTAGWAYYNENAAVRHTYPLLAEPCVMPYDGDIILFGGARQGVDAGIDGEALGCLYCSKDYGITWNKHSKMNLDERMKESAQKASFVTSTLEDDCYIWVLLDGQLWRGRLNSVLFE